MFTGLPVEFDHLLMAPMEVKKESAEVKTTTSKSILTVEETIEKLSIKESQTITNLTTIEPELLINQLINEEGYYLKYLLRNIWYNINRLFNWLLNFKNQKI